MLFNNPPLVTTKRAVFAGPTCSGFSPSLWCGYLFYVHVVRKDLLNAGLFIREPFSRPVQARVLSLVHPPRAASVQAVACLALLELLSSAPLTLRCSAPLVMNRAAPVERLHLVSPLIGHRGMLAHNLFVHLYFVWFRGLAFATEAASPRAMRASLLRNAPGSARLALLTNASFGEWGGTVGEESAASTLTRVNYLRHRPPVLGPLRSGNASVLWQDFSFTLHIPISLVRRCEEAPFLAQFRLGTGVEASLWSKKILSSFRLGQRLLVSPDQRRQDRSGQ